MHVVHIAQLLCQLRDYDASSIDEQTAIATVLSDMDAELAALEARRDKTRALKQGMMQELLTGRIRWYEHTHCIRYGAGRRLSPTHRQNLCR